MARTSNKQEEILTYVSHYLNTNHFAPSIREIGQAVGLKSISTVHYHLNALQQQGLLNIDHDRRRSITLPESSMNRIPIIGVVTAGRPILAVENIEGYLPTEGAANGRFALRIRGESMIGAGILDGDLVVVRPQQEAVNGEIVVALLDDEATVKRFLHDKSGIWLLPENPAFDPIDGKNARILGKVISLVRNY